MVRRALGREAQGESDRDQTTGRSDSGENAQYDTDDGLGVDESNAYRTWDAGGAMGADQFQADAPTGPMDPQQRERLLESLSLDTRSLQASLQSSPLQHIINHVVQSNFPGQGVHQQAEIDRLRQLGLRIQASLQHFFNGSVNALQENQEQSGANPLSQAMPPAVGTVASYPNQPVLQGPQRPQNFERSNQNLQQSISSENRPVIRPQQPQPWPVQQPNQGVPLSGVASAPPSVLSPPTLNQQVDATSNPPLRKPPQGTKMIPCRARGMSMDHNFLTAFFLLTEETRHGEQLVCSYPACRDSGIKFRYCAYCAAPVAKRNFAKRHGHQGEEPVPIIIGSENNSAVTTGADPDDTIVRSSRPVDGSSSAFSVPAFGISRRNIDAAAGPTSRGGTYADGGLYGNAVAISGVQNFNAWGDDINPETLKPAPSSKPARTKRKSSKKRFKRDNSASRHEEEQNGDADTNASLPTGASVMRPLNEVTDERKRRWASLLAMRPAANDDDAMSAWLLRVVEVSDFERPSPDNSMARRNHRSSDESSSESHSEGASSDEIDADTTMARRPKKRVHANDDRSSASSEDDQAASTMAYKSPPRPHSSSGSGSSTESAVYDGPLAENVSRSTSTRMNTSRRSKRKQSRQSPEPPDDQS